MRIEAIFDTDTWVETTIDPMSSPEAAGTAAAADATTTGETAKDDAKDKPKLSSYDAEMKVTHVRTERTFKGGIQGRGLVEYNLVYHRMPTGTDAGKADAPVMNSMCTYNGVMYFKGTIDSLSTTEGELIFTITGTWGKDGNMAAVGEWEMIKGTQTGGFKGIDVKLLSGGYDSKGKKDTPCWMVIE
ncbi:hypothetical protein FRC20_003757 [Serendipita sp. 405]|nr:hypothetical protein FRC16_003501 [Serendipita sp. 398]KAG8783799.1 hypothetical protein FRC15_004519 [Serendipita sp. 397]KAG8868245.1 hypothetical protein FRC20_003757 [Serendipita sp. 405]